MGEITKKPSIRFKGFTDDWEQRELGELCQIEKGEQLGKSEMTEVGAFYVLNGGVEPSGYTNKWNTPANTISISEGGNSCGYVNFNNCRFWSGGHNYTLKNPQIVTIYLYQFLKANERKIMAKRVGSGLPNIQKGAIATYPITFPKEKEQEAIAELLRSIDNLITLHQRKYDKFVNIKKSLLEKMFPADGETSPKIRFRGFTDAWEQRELWTITTWDKKFNEVEKEKQPRVIKYPYVLAEVFSKIEDNSGDVRLLSTGTYIGYTTEEKAGASLCEGEIVAIPWGGTPNIKYFKGKFVTADNRIAVSNDTNILKNSHIALWMQSHLKLLESLYRGASIKHPSMSDVLNLVISYPKAEEQMKISDLMFEIDNLITLHQRQLEKYKNIKKSLLEKMFV